jgi:hypothetical protein
MAMALRELSAFVMLLACVCGAAAQQSGGRLDLDRFTENPTGLVSVGAAFEDTTAVCPEDQALLKISRGALTQLRTPVQPVHPTNLQIQNARIDDQTHAVEYRTFDCRVDLLVRMQVLRDGSWVSLLLPTKSVEQRMAEARERSERMSPEERKQRFDRFRELQATGWSIGRLSTMSIPFTFDQAPGDCFEALGDYALDRRGIKFSFPTGLPGDLNRFTIERADVDFDHARFYFTRGNCRFELQIGRSVLRGGNGL